MLEPLPSDERTKAELAARILHALPQTQCSRCGYLDCAAYARAIAAGEAAINRCPPGGAEGIRRLAAITGESARPLAPECGTEAPRGVAWIDESGCIGCTLCAKACPVDCIIGTNKFMHTVIESECTGCELCVPACPVDCIHMENVTGAKTGWDAWSTDDARAAQRRYGARQARTKERERERTQSKKAKPPASARQPDRPRAAAPERTAAPHLKSSAISAALERARAKRQSFEARTPQ